MVTEHFGHCEYFIVYDIENNEKKGSEILKNPPHQKGLLPKLLKENNVDVVLAGNMGEMAQKLMKNMGIEVMCGVTGAVTDVIDSYIAGTLTTSDEVCRQHMHHGHHHE